MNIEWKDQLIMINWYNYFIYIFVKKVFYCIEKDSDIAQYNKIIFVFNFSFLYIKL